MEKHKWGQIYQARASQVKENTSVILKRKLM